MNKNVDDGLSFNRYCSRFYTDISLTKYMMSGDLDDFSRESTAEICEMVRNHTGTIFKLEVSGF